MRHFGKMLSAVWVCWAAVLPAAGDVITLSPGSDNWISSCSSGCTVNNGAMNEVRVRTSWWGSPGNREPKNFRPLLHFDTSALPDDPGLITAATLGLYYWNRPHDDPAGRTYNVYRLTNLWDETDSSWQARDEHQSAEPLYWDSYLGGQPTYQPGGGDFAETVYASADVPEDVNVWMTWDVTALVRDWVGPDFANRGLIIADSDEVESDPGMAVSYHARFRSREYSDANLWPYLEVTYIPEPASMAAFGLGLATLACRRRVSR